MSVPMSEYVPANFRLCHYFTIHRGRKYEQNASTSKCATNQTRPGDFFCWLNCIYFFIPCTQPKPCVNYHVLHVLSYHLPSYGSSVSIFDGYDVHFGQWVWLFRELATIQNMFGHSIVGCICVCLFIILLIRLVRKLTRHVFRCQTHTLFVPTTLCGRCEKLNALFELYVLFDVTIDMTQPGRDDFHVLVVSFYRSLYAYPTSCCFYRSSLVPLTITLPGYDVYILYKFDIKLFLFTFRLRTCLEGLDRCGWSRHDRVRHVVVMLVLCVCS